MPSILEFELHKGLFFILRIKLNVNINSMMVTFVTNMIVKRTTEYNSIKTNNTTSIEELMKKYCYL
jgi:hypothetical protein